MAWARKKPPVLGGLAGAALVRWLLLLKKTAGIFFFLCALSFVFHSAGINKFSGCYFQQILIFNKRKGHVPFPTPACLNLL